MNRLSAFLLGLVLGYLLAQACTPRHAETDCLPVDDEQDTQNPKFWTDGARHAS